MDKNKQFLIEELTKVGNSLNSLMRMCHKANLKVNINPTSVGDMRQVNITLNEELVRISPIGNNK